MIASILSEMTAPIKSYMEPMAQTIPYVHGKPLIRVVVHTWQKGRDNHRGRPSAELGDWSV